MEYEARQGVDKAGLTNQLKSKYNIICYNLMNERLKNDNLTFKN